MRDAILCIDGDRAALERAGHLDMEQYPLLGQAMQSEASLAIAVYVTYETAEMLLAFGLVPWARYGAWLGSAAMVLGIFSMVSTLGARRSVKLPFGSMLGLLSTGLAATMLGSFMWAFGLGPF